MAQDLEDLRKRVGEKETDIDYVTIPAVHRLSATLDRWGRMPDLGQKHQHERHKGREGRQREYMRRKIQWRFLSFILHPYPILIAVYLRFNRLLISEAGED